MSWLPAGSGLRSVLCAGSGAQPGTGLGIIIFFLVLVRDAHSPGTWLLPFLHVKAWGKITLFDQLSVFGKVKLFRAKPPTLQAQA